MAISPIAMLPPFRLEIPVRFGSTSRVGAAMNRLIGLGLPPPAGRSSSASSPSCCRSPSGMIRLDVRVELHQRFPARDAGSSATTTPSSRGSAGSAWSSWSCPVGQAIDATTLGRFRRRRAGDRRDPARRRARRSSHVISLATVLDPDGRLAALARRGPAARILADKLDLIAASPQAELLNGFWNPETGQARHPGPALGAAAGPGQGGDLRRRPSTAARATFGADVVPDRPVVPDDQDDRGDHRHPVEHVPLVGRRASC